MKLVELVLFNIATSKWGVQLDLLGIIEEAAINCGFALDTSKGRI